MAKSNILLSDVASALSDRIVSHAVWKFSMFFSHFSSESRVLQVSDLGCMKERLKSVQRFGDNSFPSAD